METGKPAVGAHQFVNPVQGRRFHKERLITSVVIAATIAALGPLGPYRFIFAAGLLVVQVTSTLLVRNRFESEATELGVFLMFDHSIKVAAPFFMAAAWAPAVVVAMYSIGVNAAFLTKRWLYLLTSLSLVGAAASAVLIRPPGGGPVFVIAAIVGVHAVSNRGSAAVTAGHAFDEMHELQVVATEAAADAQWLASHDPLTGLSNRRAFTDRLSELTATDTPIALVLLDLDGFKLVNDNHGHHYGDLMLIEVGNRLAAVATDGSTGTIPLVVRLGGDEFAVLWPNATLPQARLLAERAAAAFIAPAQLEGLVVRIRASLGVAVNKGAAAKRLFHEADVAMYVAKRRGGGIAVFDDSVPPPVIPARHARPEPQFR